VPVLNIWGCESIRRKNANVVDLNRNYGWRWDRCILEKGTDCLQQSSCSYHGPAPFSEPETQAMRDLALEQRFGFGIDYPHGETAILYPWGNNEEAPAPPDRAQILELARSHSPGVWNSRRSGGLRQSGSPIANRKACKAPAVGANLAAGQSLNCYYAATGTIACLVEIAERRYNDSYFCTPDPTDDNRRSVRQAEEHVLNLSDGVKHWLRNFLHSRQSDQFVYGGPGVTGRVTDAQAGQPVQAQVEVTGFTSDLIETRTGGMLRYCCRQVAGLPVQR
jgi:hypothetical protein